MISQYLTKASVVLDADLVESCLEELDLFLTQYKDSFQGVWSYRIPELGAGGACSLFGALQEAPFELTTVVVQNEASVNALNRLQTIVEFIKKSTGVDWFGIYQARMTEEGKQLAKLAYHGAESRPLFPLSSDFAKISNNVQVGLSGKARIIQDVEVYLTQGGEYYTCDPKVKAEVCLPLFDEKGSVIGIIDAESFTHEFFSPALLAYFVAVSIKIPHYLPR
ncbi:FIG00951979: hypothetical protein [Pseudoalteromonas luteoviolacea B = ATCC 29581]|nr:FIG00951979: hypothetical protein [Pseudoalteromonas luteoviolacea B = ATCC 29581]